LWCPHDPRRALFGVAVTDPPSCQITMKRTVLVLMLSTVAICDTSTAGETMLRDQNVAQVNQPSPTQPARTSSSQTNSSQTSSSQANSSGGSCMPIGLTARGELVFPWECRAIIERERGPVSVDISPSSKNTAEDIAKDPAPNTPAAGGSVGKSAAVDDAATKNQATPKNADVEQVATIPEAVSSPAQPAATIAPLNRKPQGKRLAVRARTDVKGAPILAQPSTVRPIR
jgi:hypothetical protein